MLFINNISIYFSGISLLENINFNVTPKHKIGLIGKNGVGKSTILRCLASELDPNEGKVILEAGKTLGYLPQEIHNDSTKTIIDEVKTIFDDVIQIQKDVDKLTLELGERTDYEEQSYYDLAEELANKVEALEFMNVSKQEGNIEKVLKGLGFNQEDFDKGLQSFSGGWQMRVELAKLLIKNPDVLLLDEPTNHLDIESIIWLENYLKEFAGAIIMISHDRQFLDNITNRTIEIVNKKIYDHPVPYTKFMGLREERISQQLSAKKNQDAYIKQQERFIERFKAKATKAKQAQSKQKQLDKVERIEIDDTDNDLIQFRFPDAPRSGDVVLKGKAVTKDYGPKNILNDIEFSIARGEKIAFVGQNGQGKSTLVKMIMKETGYEGEITIGHNVEVGYYAQQQEKELDGDKTVIQTIDDVSKDEWTKEHRQRALLGSFLFGENDVNKKVKVLSGGEKGRLALALMLMDTTNLLVMDEPTNHLDMASKEILKQALINYNGTLVVVSHDRDFLQGLSTRTYEFKDHKIKEHLGPIDEFLAKHHAETFRAFEMGKDVISKHSKTEVKSEEKPKNNKNYKALKKLKNSIGRMERKIDEQEKIIKELEAKIALDQNNKDLFFEHAEAQKALDMAMADWEKFSEEYERLNS